jgi:hypothetical protein
MIRNNEHIISLHQIKKTFCPPTNTEETFALIKSLNEARDPKKTKFYVIKILEYIKNNPTTFCCKILIDYINELDTNNIFKIYFANKINKDIYNENDNKKIEMIYYYFYEIPILNDRNRFLVCGLIINELILSNSLDINNIDISEIIKNICVNYISSIYTKEELKDAELYRYVVKMKIIEIMELELIKHLISLKDDNIQKFNHIIELNVIKFLK